MIVRVAVAVALCASLAAAQEPKRPRITGVAHAALYVHDLEKSRAFYKDFLGYSEPFSLSGRKGDVQLIFIKINDRQYLELFVEKEAGSDRLNHLAIETDDAAAMREYLVSRGVKVPEKVNKGRIGNSNFNVQDPDGHTIEIVQYEPDSWTAREKGNYMTHARISTRLRHIGISVGALEPAMKFYRDILGFRETWRGGPKSTTLAWLNMQVPDGDDYIEFTLYAKRPTGERLGMANHICLEVPDVAKAKETLEARPARKDYPRTFEVQTGINRKRQTNLFDPDGTRIEMMEPQTVDGLPAPSSTAPPPQ